MLTSRPAHRLQRLVLGGTLAVVLCATSAATAVAAAPVDLQVTNASGTAHQVARVGTTVSETFTVSGVPVSASVVVLDIDWGTSFDFVSAAPVGGDELTCDLDGAGRHAECAVTTVGSSVQVLVRVSAARPGVDSQYLQLAAAVRGVPAVDPGDHWAAASYRVHAADLQLLAGSRTDGRVVRGADVSQYRGVSAVDLVAASSAPVQAELVLARVPGSAPVDIALATLAPGGAALTCTGSTSAGELICPLGNLVPGARTGVYISFSAPSTATVGGVGVIRAELRPTPGQGAGLTTSGVDVSAVIDPNAALSTTLTSDGVGTNASGSLTDLDVSVGAPRTVRLTITNTGPDLAPGAVARFGTKRFLYAVPAGLPSLFSLEPRTSAGGLAQDTAGWWTWTPGAVPAGQSRTVEIVVTALRRGVVSPGSSGYAERLLLEPASVRFEDGAQSARSECTSSRNEPGDCFATLGVAPGLAALGSGGSVRDVDADGFADLSGIDQEGDLHLYPSDLGAGRGTPFAEDVVVGTGWGSFVQAVAADVDGDGTSDVVAADSAGVLWLYRNGLQSGTDAPYGSGTRIGSGWRGFPQVTAGDVSGDGKADLIATGPDGRLWYFVNTGDATAPYGTGRAIGSGWRGYTHVTAGDVSGDGSADLVATGPDGRLWYFPNNSSSNPGRVPFVHGAAIGSGWQGFRHVELADLTGDGSADLVAVDPVGALLHFPNNRSSNPGGVPYTRAERLGWGWDIFRVLL